MKRIYLLLPILAGIMFGSTGIFVRTLTENGVDSTTLRGYSIICTVWTMHPWIELMLQ